MSALRTKAREFAHDGVTNDGNPVHVFPHKDDHVTTPQCWCRPVLDYRSPVTGVEVWVHHTKEEVLQ